VLDWARQAAKQDAKELKVFLDLASKIVKVDKLSELQQFYQERLTPDLPLSSARAVWYLSL
jgi:hypothetical protein